jgi:glycosyltransferase involved in cell wall biosynthesis
MSEYPLVSIITAVRNGAPYLRQLIESVLRQDYSNLEHIIIDDGSNDNGATVSILRSYSHLRWWSRDNKGQYATQNEGLAAARGFIIGIISADDMYVTPNALSKVVEYWQAHPHCGLVYGRTWHMDEQGRLLPYQLDIAGRYPRWFIKYYPYVPHSSLFVARTLIEEHRLWFNPMCKYYGDWDWIISLFRASQGIHYLPEYLSMLRVHASQTSRTANPHAVVQERRMICQKHGTNYHVHILSRRLIQYRAMTLIAIAVLRTRGVSALAALGKDWLKRRHFLRPGD